MRGRLLVVGLLVATAACSSGSSASSEPERVRSITNPDVIVFMDPTAPSAQTAAVRRAIRHSDEVERYEYRSHADAYREMKKLEVGSDLAAVTRPSDLPESFGLALRSGARWRPLAARLDRMTGVQAVGNPEYSRRGTCRDLRKRFAKPPAWMERMCADAMGSR